MPKPSFSKPEKRPFIAYGNAMPEKYYIVKWDLIFNIVFFASWLYIAGFRVLGILLFSMVFVTSYFIFHYTGYGVTITFLILSLFPFSLVIIDPVWNLPTFFLVLGCGMVSYALFWLFLTKKNRQRYMASLQPEVCIYCGEEKQKYVIHMGRRMCQDCFLQEAFEVVSYHDTDMYRWDHDILRFFELEIGEPIPEIPFDGQFDITEYQFDNIFGYGVEDQNLVFISIPFKNLKHLPHPIGLLVHLRALNLRGNQLPTLPYSLTNLIKLQYLDVRENPMPILLPEAQKALFVLQKHHCKILR